MIDWFDFKSTATAKIMQLEPDSILSNRDETQQERKLRMLRPLARLCMTCSCCDLGIIPAEKNGIIRDPHVLSNMNPSRFLIVGQGPGWNELERREPFVGAAGKNFDDEIIKHGLSRNDFYITNTVKCYIKDNAKPDAKNISRCEPFLQMEINLFRPKLIMTLGSVAFGQLCPDHVFGESLKKIVKSKYDIPVFAIYHPSPLNLADASRKEAFAQQIGVMCGLVKALKIRDNI